MFTRPFYVPPTYEDLEAKYESKETPESHLLLVHIPDGLFCLVYYYLISLIMFLIFFYPALLFRVHIKRILFFHF